MWILREHGPPNCGGFLEGIHFLHYQLSYAPGSKNSLWFRTTNINILETLAVLVFLLLLVLPLLSLCSFCGSSHKRKVSAAVFSEFSCHAPSHNVCCFGRVP